METLAVKYRPTEFNDVCGQSATIRILEKQLELRQFKNSYLFTGPSGVGKTTLARIFANKINGGNGSPIEIDAASNNGVDNIRSIVASAQERSLDSEYKIYIIDECHQISNAGWNAFLKCIEEPPHYTIFMFCTTDVQKVPATIINRVQRFNLTRLNINTIFDRLNDICNYEAKEGNYIHYDPNALDYICKISNGSVRQAITYFEKCLDYSNELTLDNVFEVLGNFHINTYIDLVNMIVDKDSENIIKLIDSIYNKGKDLKLFIDELLTFSLDLSKYCLFKDLHLTNIPSSFKQDIDYLTDNGQQGKYFLNLQDSILNIKNTIKYDTSLYSTVLVMLLNLVK